MSITATVTGARDVALRLEKLPIEVNSALREVVERETAALFAAVTPPIGKTGRTAAAKRMKIVATDNSVIGTVYFKAPGRELAKIGALEYGTRGKRRPVQRHHRRLNHFFGHQMQPIDVIVEKYMRTPRIAARRFLRGPLEARKAAIAAEMQNAVNRAAAGK
jgi:hypothetical protein